MIQNDFCSKKYEGALKLSCKIGLNVPDTSDFAPVILVTTSYKIQAETEVVQKPFAGL